MTRPHFGLVTAGGSSRANQQRKASRYAALIDAIQSRRRLDRVNGKLVAGARRQGFIDDMGAVTAWGIEWRAGCPVPPADFESICSRKPVTYSEKQNAVFRQYPKPRPVFSAQPFIDEGMIVLDGEFIHKAGPEELKLFAVAKLHECEGLTYAGLAAILGWPVEHVRIRADRIAAIGGILVIHETDAA